jgi:hypothetical protein
MKAALGALFVVLLCLVGGPFVVASPAGEYQIKAAYLLNFARYVEWPAARLPAGAALRACVLGRDPFGGALGALEGRQVNGHELRVRQLDGAAQTDDCQVVFVAESEERRLGAVLRMLAGRGLLLVSDIDGFAEAGGSIGLVTEDGRVRFDINQASLQRDGLRASAQLLRLARTVHGARTP